MVDDTSFSPDWLSPPGDTISSILDERKLSPAEFAQEIKCTKNEVGDLLEGRAHLTEEVAEQIAHVLGSTPEFWIRRESRYRHDLARLEREASTPASLQWLDDLPTKDMMNWGWVKAASDPKEKIATCLHFFGVSNLADWQKSYEDVLVAIAFRKSPAYESQPGAIAAWLRQGEIAASSIECAPWRQERFRTELFSIRGLTREGDPGVFLPELIRRCAACGVAVVILRAPKKCRASGASRFLSPTRPMLLFSFRYLSDDHFWFTFFHEAAHLLLHGERFIFLEGDDNLSSIEEDEANAFAAEMLVPAEYQEEMNNLPMNARAVIRFARKVGVSKGIVVGQLQHRGRLRRNQLNNLKQRYVWEDD
jgi:HTH-type transcriptional regulator / antitoxin HigA